MENWYDYAQLYRASGNFLVEKPTTLGEVQEAMRWAWAKGTGVRVRGHGHTWNGRSLPQEDQILIATGNLCAVTRVAPKVLHISCGVRLWDLNLWLMGKGFTLPVINGGGPGPSLGGFISSGGLPRTSDVQQGGFWEHVLNVQVLDAQGNLHDIDQQHPHFPWLFGSWGQIGLIVGAHVRLQPLGHVPQSLPLGKTYHITDHLQEAGYWQGKAPPYFGTYQELWFSFLAAKHQETYGWNALLQLVERYSQTLIPILGYTGPLYLGEAMGYRHFVPCRGFTPPLVYPRHEDFSLIGFRSRVKVGSSEALGSLLKIRQHMRTQANALGLSLYLQAEQISRRLDLAAYFGTSTFNKWLAIKNQYDPQHKINGGEVFHLP